jgi:cytochrome c oxidase cbb3-type subunit 2
MASSKVLWTTVVAVSTVVAAGCGKNTAAGDPNSLTPPFLETPVGERPSSSPALVERGRQSYLANCSQCHGEAGRGDGYGAPFLVPPPRDFTTAEYKFRTTASGAIPTDHDLFRIISRGVNGTGMPPWQYLLDDEERWALVDYIKTLSPKFAGNRPPAVAPLPDPPSERANAERGRAVFDKMQCSKCHGEDGRGIGPSSRTLTDSKGRIVNVRDFTNPGTFRTGWTAREIVRTLETGNNGVPMPSYSKTMTAQEEYDLAAYIMSLAGHGAGDQKRPTARSMAGLGAPDRVITLREHAWRYEPAEMRIKAGEVVRVDFSATDNGLGAGHGFAIDGFDQEVFINGAMVGAPQSVTFKIDRPGRYDYYCSTQCSTTELHPRMHGVMIVE